MTTQRQTLLLPVAESHFQVKVSFKSIEKWITTMNPGDDELLPIGMIAQRSGLTPPHCGTTNHWA